jgi:biotin synthase
MGNRSIATITEELVNGKKAGLSYEEACALARSDGKNTMDLLFAAHKVTQRCKKGPILTCAIINAKSGACSEDCAFCAQSIHHQTEIKPHPLLKPDRIVADAERMWKAGASRYSLVTSGLRLRDEELKSIARTTEAIQERTGLGICTSLGTLTGPMAEKLKRGGVTMYHHNLETAESYFDRICTTHAYSEDIETLEVAKSAGMKICSGGILGLGESPEQRVELAFTLKKLDVDRIPINFLNPIPGTKLAHRKPLSPWEALRSIALFRLINPDTDITICGGRESTLKDFQSWIFFAGANGLMIGNYLTTRGRDVAADMDMIRDVERACD